MCGPVELEVGVTPWGHFLVMRRLFLDIPMRALIAVLLLTALSAACADGSKIAAQAPLTFGEPQALGRVYRLGVGDKLRITVFGEENLSGQLEVNAFGQVPMPLIGEIEAKGASISEFKDRIARKLSEGYLKNPKVSVEILNYRSIFVHGEVKNGGEFQFKNGLKFRDAIAMAGGYTYRANQKYVLVVREGEQEGRIDLPSDLPVLPGDNIRVMERFF